MIIPKHIEHRIVYRRDTEYCGWPFNGGFWQFSDRELAVGFIRCPCTYHEPARLNHSVLDNLTGEQVIVRSYDEGDTWDFEHPESVYARPDFDVRVRFAPSAAVPRWESRPLTDDFCLLSGFGIPPADDRTAMFIMCSYDRGRTWEDPARVPVLDGFEFLGGRPSYVVREDGMILLFGHGGRGPGKAGLRPLVLGSTDAGASWGLLGEIDPVPTHPNCIMPYPLIASDGRILIAVRREYGSENHYTQVYESHDHGRSFRLLSRVNDWGAPASLNQLPDGRIVCVYGYRRPPYGIRARVSEDGAHTWGAEVILRDDGGSGDLGYPRTHLRADGALVTVYYFNEAHDAIQMRGGVRYIAATIWGI